MLRQIARERRSAVIAVTHDHRMIEGFDTVYHLDDGRLARVERSAPLGQCDPAPSVNRVNHDGRAGSGP
jgi:putative ABC transport system ATP-binding protein